MGVSMPWEVVMSIQTFTLQSATRPRLTNGVLMHPCTSTGAVPAAQHSTTRLVALMGPPVCEVLRHATPRPTPGMKCRPCCFPRGHSALQCLMNCSLLSGGYNGYSDSYNVQCYDGTTDEWHVACDMDFARSDVSCCVVSGLSNMADYVVPRDFLPCLNLEDESSDSAESLDSV